MNRETILAGGPGGRVLTNANVWSADGEWIVFDTRSDPAGSIFDGTRIRAVHVETREVRTLYESRNGAHCGVVTCHPFLPKAVCILGPEHPTADWNYGPSRRQGIVLDFAGGVANLDARDLAPPFTPGALRGGSHLHMWHPNGDWVGFTYEDEVRKDGRRDIGVAYPNRPVTVPKSHPRNHDGEYFGELVTRTTKHPRVDSDEISRACEEAWIGATRSLAFQGTVMTSAGPVVEVFLVEPLRGGFVQHRLTRTTHRKFPGLRGPRHWLRSSPDGARIGCFMRDDRGVAQFFTVNLAGGGELQQVTDGDSPMESAFTWHPDGRRVACVIDGSVCLIDAATGTVTRLTPKGDPAEAPRPEACVFSPDGDRIAFVRTRAGSNRICVVDATCTECE